MMSVSSLPITLMRTFFFLLCMSVCLPNASAQIDIKITGAQVGFPVAAPQLCNAGQGEGFATRLAEIVRRDLEISGFFKVLEPSSYVESPGKCNIDEVLAYSDWSVIGTEGLIKGDVKRVGQSLSIRFYLHDVLQRRAVLGKKYEVDQGDAARVAHKFANEVVAYFTGQPGVFGSQIAYVSRMGRFKELHVMDMDGSNIKQLTYDRGLAITPSWSPDASRIVYTSYKTRRPELYTISSKGGDVRRITKREGMELGAEYSPDGKYLAAAASVSGVSKLALFDLRGKMVKRLTSSSSIDVSPTWSPQGDMMAFCSNRSGGPQIYLINKNGSGLRRFSFTSSNYCTSPSWSPKGDKIAFVCRVGSRNQVFVSSYSDGKAVQLTYSGNNEDPSFSPDGRYLAISTTAVRGPRSVAMISLQTGQIQQLTRAKSEDSQPAWSPLVD